MAANSTPSATTTATMITKSDSQLNATMLTTNTSSINTTNNATTVSKISYTVNTLYRIETMNKAILQTRKLVQQTQEKLEQRLQHLHTTRPQVKQLQRLQMKINLLGQELNREREQVEQLKQRKATIPVTTTTTTTTTSPTTTKITSSDIITLNTTTTDNNTCNRILGDVEQCGRMADCFEQIKRQRQLIDDKFQQINQIHRLISFRRRQVCSELFATFPIVPFPDNRGGFSIVGIHLPNTDSLTSHDDQMVEAALGHVCQMLIVLCKLIDLPLRFDILFCGSQNWIVDHCADLQSFPLFNAKRDRSRFNYAVFLLNRNIAQIRHHFQLPTTDVRTTLYNLYSLFKDRLMTELEERADQEQEDNKQSTDDQIRSSCTINSCSASNGSSSTANLVESA